MRHAGPLLVFLALGGMVALTAHEVLTTVAAGSGGPPGGASAAGAGPAAGDRTAREGPPAGAGVRSGRGAPAGEAPPVAGADRKLDGLRVRVSRRRHAVSGTTVRQLRRSMDREGRRIEGETAPAWTDWDVGVGYDYRREGGRCRLTRPDVEVSVTVHLPRWSDSARAPASLRERWRRDVRAMERHEEGHVRLARRAGRRVHRALSALPGADCGELRARADSAAAAVLARAREAQRRYDDVTDHGRRQERAAGLP